MHQILKRVYMESTSTKEDVIKPVLLKAGIPLAIAAAGFIFARIIRRKGSDLDGLPVINNRSEGCSQDLESLDSSYLSCFDSYHSSPEPEYQQTHELEEEILVLRSQLKDIHVRELELEVQYLHYREIKGQELVVMELEKMLLLEITRAQLLDRDVSAEAERQRFQKMVVESRKVFGLLQFSRSRNRMLRRRIRKLLKKTEEQSRLIREQRKQIEAKEAVNSRSNEVIAAKTEIIRKLEDEIQEHKTTLWILQEEKNDLSTSQTDLAHNKTASSKTDAEKENMEGDCRQVASTILEKREAEGAVETEELIYLRWSNACLRHELTRKNQEEQAPKNQVVELESGEIGYFGSNDEPGHSTLENQHSCLNFPTTIGHASASSHSKRKKLIDKLKSWVD